MKTILLTGGSGFIGQNVRHSFLAEKYHILSPKHQELDLNDEDALDSFLARHQPNFLIHAACKPAHRNATDLRAVFYTNTRMFFNLQRRADLFEKILFIGSGSVYDMRRYQPKMKEEHAWDVLPSDELGLYKHVCSRAILNSKNMIDLRVFGIFGPYEDYAIRFISNAVCKTLFDLPITIKQDRKFDYIWVQDFLRLLDLFLENNVQEKAYNITPDKAILLTELAQMVKQVSAKELPILVSQQGLGLEYSGDNTRLKTEFPNVSFTPLEESVKMLYNWYKERQNTLDKNVLLMDK